MIWLDVIYAKAGEIAALLYMSIGNIGTEIVNSLEAIGKILGT